MSWRDDDGASEGNVISIADAQAILGYARQSWENEDKIESQRAEIEAWAAERGLRVVGFFADDPCPGDRPLEMRLGLFRAVLAIEAGHIRTFVVRDYERLARHEQLQEQVFSRIWEAGGRIYTTRFGEVLRDRPGSYSRETHRLYFARAAEDARRALREARAYGRARKQAQGGYIGGRRFGGRPYGMELVADFPVQGKSDYRPVPHEQEIIRRVCADHERGVSYCEIARRLNAEGIPTVTGVPWVHKVVRGLVLRGPAGLMNVLVPRPGAAVRPRSASAREARSA